MCWCFLSRLLNAMFEPKIIVEFLGVFIGAGIPIGYDVLHRRNRDLKGRNSFLRWCEVTTKSNISNINDLFKRLEKVRNTNSLYAVWEINREVMQELDIDSYTAFLTSGLYKDTEKTFQDTFFHCREFIKNYSVIDSFQRFNAKDYSEQRKQMREFEQGIMDITFINGLVKEISERLEAIKNHSEKILDYISQEIGVNP